MPSASSNSEQIAREISLRARLAVPAFAGGLLYLLSGIIVSASLRDAPTVGMLQALGPALRGEAAPAVSPRTAEVKFISHHALTLLAGGAFSAIAIAILVLTVVFLLDAARFRRPETWPPARVLVIVGGAGLALFNLVHAVLLAITTHKFAVGHDFSAHAADTALQTAGAAPIVLGLASFAGALALAAGMSVTMLAAMRVGLTPRWLSILGIFSALFFLPLFASATLELVTAFWLVAMGILYIGKWPQGDPPAWAAGEARPWPTGAEMRAARRREGGAPVPAGAGAGDAGADVGPAPTQPSNSRSARRRKRKRAARRG